MTSQVPYPVQVRPRGRRKLILTNILITLTLCAIALGYYAWKLKPDQLEAVSESPHGPYKIQVVRINNEQSVSAYLRDIAESYPERAQNLSTDRPVFILEVHDQNNRLVGHNPVIAPLSDTPIDWQFKWYRDELLVFNGDQEIAQCIMVEIINQDTQIWSIRPTEKANVLVESFQHE